MEHEDIIPEGLEGKTEEERQQIIKRWEHLHDLKQAILDGKMPEERDQLPEIEKELSEASKQLEPREPVPESGVLYKDGKQYVLCPRCGTFVHITKDRVDEVVWEFEEKAEEPVPAEAAEDDWKTSAYLIRSINCPVCKWGLGLPEEQ